MSRPTLVVVACSLITFGCGDAPTEVPTVPTEVTVEAPLLTAALALVPPVTTDAWDVANGTVVTANTPVLNLPFNKIQDMFGKLTLGNPDVMYGDNRAAGTIHWVEWQTTAPRSIERFNLVALHDDHPGGSIGPRCKLPGFPLHRDANHRGLDHFTLLAWNSTTGMFDIVLYDADIALGNDDGVHPGEGAKLYDPTGANHPHKHILGLEAAITPVSTDRWRAEFRQVGCASAESGPRIRELDGFEASNSPPSVASDNDPVQVDEGITAGNMGTVDDDDGDVVVLSASVGAVTNNNDGTWSWSFPTSDGPSESQTVTVDADDGNGGTAQTAFDLIVNNVAPTVDAVAVPGAPVAIGDQPISASATFSDPAGTADENYTCTVDYGDGSGPQGGIVAGTACAGPDQTYAEGGVYTVTVAVTDKDNDTGSLESETMIIIYDPSGGFVTGGGWFNSPAGAFKAEALLTGKANFGFVSKYKKGASVPTGNTEFQFKAGDLNFHSSSYEWLVVNQNGENAQFRGEGTINGAGVYKFMLWAGDTSPDTFRIRITEVGGGIIYDNDLTGPGDQPIDGGSIKIHSN